ncbi:MAG: hypothetical protein Q4D27_00435 [Coriobacteriia bacterium]|nr:hypothetical protein [Coriobacteriia bacterium]
MLGVSDARVRAMLANGQLEGEKMGRAWAVSGASVRTRLKEGARPGRPAAQTHSFTRSVPDVEDAHRLYDEAQALLAGCYNAELLDQARDEDEQAFWILVADFFLQRAQKELIAEGAY